MTLAIGIDPGTTSGALVIASRERTMFAMAWQAMERGTRWRIETVGGMAGEGPAYRRSGFAMTPALPMMLAGLAPTRSAVEGIGWYGAGKSGPHTIPLAESAGAAVEWVRHAYGVDPLRPAAHEWRRVVLGLSHLTKAKRAEAYAIEALGVVVPALPDACAGWTKAERGAAAEAACLARYALVMP